MQGSTLRERGVRGGSVLFWKGAAWEGRHCCVGGVSALRRRGVAGASMLLALGLHCKSITQMQEILLCLLASQPVFPCLESR